VSTNGRIDCVASKDETIPFSKKTNGRIGLRAGFFVTIWIAAVMFKSNDILRKQTALKVH